MKEMIDTPELPSAWMRSADYVVRYDFSEASGGFTAAVGGSGFDLTTVNGSDFGSASNIWEGSQSSRSTPGPNDYYDDTLTGATKTTFDTYLETQTGMWYCAFTMGSDDTSITWTRYGTAASGSSRRSFNIYFYNGVFNLLHHDNSSTVIIPSPFTLPNNSIYADHECLLTVSWKPAISGTAGKIDVHFFFAQIPYAAAGEPPMIYSGWTREQDDFNPAESDIDLQVGAAGNTCAYTLHEMGWLSFCGEEPTSHYMLRHMWPGYSDELAWETMNNVPVYRILVEDGDGEWFNLSGNQYRHEQFKQLNYVREASWGDGNDQEFADATITLTREYFNYSLAPLMGDSVLNLNAAGSYDQLLDARRAIRIDTCQFPIVPFDPVSSTYKNNYADSGPWTTAFEGFIENEIDVTDEVIVLKCADKLLALKDVIQKNATDLGTSTIDATDAIDDLIIDIEPTDGYKGGRPELWIRDPTTFQLAPESTDTTVVINEATALDAINKVVYAYGAGLKFMFDDQRGYHRLAHYEPDRTSPSSAYTFEPEYIQDVSTSRINAADLRTEIIVRYSVGSNDDGSPKLTDVSNTGSITTTARSKYGTLTGIIVNSLIKDGTNALALADNVARDLSDTLLEWEIQVPYFPWVEVADYYTLSAFYPYMSSNQSAAVSKFNHLLTPNGAITNIVLNGNPKVSRRRYGPMLGIFMPDTAPPAPVSVAATGTQVRQVTVTWDAAIVSPTNTANVEVSRYLVYGSTTNGFTPSSSNLLGTVQGTSFIAKDLVGETKYYFKVVAVSRNGVVSSASSQASAYSVSVPAETSVVLISTGTGLSSGTNYQVGGLYFTNELVDEGGITDTVGGYLVVKSPYDGKGCAFSVQMYMTVSSATSGSYTTSFDWNLLKFGGPSNYNSLDWPAGSSDPKDIRPSASIDLSTVKKGMYQGTGTTYAYALGNSNDSGINLGSVSVTSSNSYTDLAIDIRLIITAIPGDVA